MHSINWYSPYYVQMCCLVTMVRYLHMVKQPVGRRTPWRFDTENHQLPVSWHCLASAVFSVVQLFYYKLLVKQIISSIYSIFFLIFNITVEQLLPVMNVQCIIMLFKFCRLQHLYF